MPLNGSNWPQIKKVRPLLSIKTFLVQTIKVVLFFCFEAILGLFKQFLVLDLKTQKWPKNAQNDLKTKK